MYAVTIIESTIICFATSALRCIAINSNDNIHINILLYVIAYNMSWCFEISLFVNWTIEMGNIHAKSNNLFIWDPISNLEMFTLSCNEWVNNVFKAGASILR